MYYTWFMTQRTSAQLICWTTYSWVCLGNHTYIMGNCLYWIAKCICFYDGSQFRETFADTCEIHDDVCERSGTQHHSALRIGDRYNELIRNAFWKLRIDHPKLEKLFLLNLANKTCNDTLEPEWFVLSALVLGEFSSLRCFSDPKYPKLH